MAQDEDIKVFLANSNLYMHVEALTAHWEQDFVRAIHGFTREAEKEAFRRGFAKACLGGVTAKEYEKATGWDFESDEAFHEHLSRYWHLFYPDANPADFTSPTSDLNSTGGYRGWKIGDGATVSYAVERADGATVVRVTELKLLDRVLRISYELASPSMYDGLARRLIRQKILGDVCLGAYDALADTISYTSATTSNIATVPYADKV